MLKILKKIDRFLLPNPGEYHYAAYIWLVYLGMFYLSLYFSHPVKHSFYFAFIATILFLVAYFKAYSASSSAIKWYILIILLVGSWMSLISTGASVFFVYAASFCCGLGSTRKALLGILFISVWIAAVVLLFNLAPYFYIPAIVFSFLIGGMNIYHHDMGLKRKELILSQQEVKHLAKISERERIARDLHDLIGHTFSMITLKAELAGKLMDQNSTKAQCEIKQIENISRDALKQIREVVSGYRTSDLSTELAYARYVLESNGIHFTYEFDAIEMSELINKELAIILKELITNVLKHAHASQASATIHLVNKCVVLNVKDDGIGFINKKHTGFGLKGIQERVEKLSGQLRIESTANTVINISVPIGNKRD